MIPYKLETISVETNSFKVGKKYYSFNYEILRNGKLISRGKYESSHVRSPNSIRRWLAEGWGTELVLRDKGIKKGA